ncbi:MAG: BMP family ABC transporter substrate-binding protein [Chloroflexi bacterium]|nr:BMP family ABC transporter substrate-binding protein [Chloroflexota bacterium]
MFKNRAAIVLALLLVGAVVLTGCKTSQSTEALKFGVVLVGPYNDHGWSQAHYEGAQYAETKVSGASMIYLDKLNSSDRQGTTLEQVVEDMVAQGAKIIFTTSDDFQADTDTVAAKYPDIKFVMVSGDHAKTGVAPSNVTNVMGKMEYMKAVAGCAAALKTESKSIAYLGPLINSETRRLASSAYLGARDCYEQYRGGDPNELKFTVNWIGFWFNIPGVTLDPTQVSNDLFNQGADVILSGIDTTEAIVVAGQRADKGEKVWAIPYDYVGACDLKPEICLGTPYFNWGPTYVKYLEAYKNGSFKQDFVWNDPDWKNINDRDTSAVGYAMGDGLSDADKKNLEDYISKLASGEIKLFTGPINLQDGTVYVADGQVATDDQIWNLPQLLEGMQGASQ